MQTEIDKQGIRVIFVLIFMIAIVICIGINTIRANNKKYEYYKDGKFGISNECYMNEKDDPMCLIDNKFIWVESYYEVEK